MSDLDRDANRKKVREFFWWTAFGIVALGVLILCVWTIPANAYQH